VFHGRDVFAPAAAHLAAVRALDACGTPVDATTLARIAIEDAEVERGRIHGEVLDVDRFGNVRLNIRPADLDRAGFVIGSMVEVATTAGSVRTRRITAYSDVRPGEYGLLVDAWDWAAVIRYELSAADGMGITRGEPVWLATGDQPGGRPREPGDRPPGGPTRGVSCRIPRRTRARRRRCPAIGP
jgi:S-adenosylmethionine hydrolase